MKFSFQHYLLKQLKIMKIYVLIKKVEKMKNLSINTKFLKDRFTNFFFCFVDYFYFHLMNLVGANFSLFFAMESAKTWKFSKTGLTRFLKITDGTFWMKKILQFKTKRRKKRVRKMFWKFVNSYPTLYVNFLLHADNPEMFSFLHQFFVSR